MLVGEDHMLVFLAKEFHQIMWLPKGLNFLALIRRRLQRSPRLVLDYLRMTENARKGTPAGNYGIRTN